MGPILYGHSVSKCVPRDEGFSNKEIAERLVLAEGTVKNRVSDIFLKIDARDRTRAELRARDLGLL